MCPPNTANFWIVSILTQVFCPLEHGSLTLESRHKKSFNPYSGFLSVGTTRLNSLSLIGAGFNPYSGFLSVGTSDGANIAASFLAFQSLLRFSVRWNHCWWDQTSESVGVSILTQVFCPLEQSKTQYCDGFRELVSILTQVFCPLEH